jgi:UDP-glucose:(heptosyl)LPS alpha-1,3-glucosyltransferase
LLVGNDARKKGLACVIRALAVLDDPAVFVAVVGHPGQRAVWDALARDGGVAAQLHFVGMQEDVGLAYMAADVLVHPTLEDTYAMVVLEAMSHGLPVIVSQSAYCGISSELTHGANAWLLQDPHDAHALADAVRRIHESPDSRKTTGCARPCICRPSAPGAAWRSGTNVCMPIAECHCMSPARIPILMYHPD